MYDINCQGLTMNLCLTVLPQSSCWNTEIYLTCRILVSRKLFSYFVTINLHLVMLLKSSRFQRT